jgi:23S rRNA (uracil1939-C5)-methyltransferase
MEHEITLEKFTYGGDAMGRLPDGRAAFVPFALPGERVRIRLVDEKRGFARGELLEILQPSAERIEARCRHFTVCGGCHYQNLPYEKQLTVKTDILRDQLQRIGKIEHPPVRAMVPSPQAWNYRNHMQFHLTPDGTLGFVNAKGNGVIPITECHLPEGAIHITWPQLSFEPNTQLERVSLRSGQDDELTLLLESESPEAPELELEADISVVHLFDDHPLVIAGQGHFLAEVLGREFQVSAGSFFQVNTKMAEHMVGHLLEKLPIISSTTLLDVYCGAGLFSKFFAPKCARVIGVESSASACEDFTVNLDEFENVELYEGLAEEIVPHLEVKPDIILVDPPRAGLEKNVLDGILKLSPQVIAYVSCDPSTLARDAARLIAGGYRLTDVVPFDMFPQTFHIESISLFER